MSLNAFAVKIIKTADTLQLPTIESMIDRKESNDEKVPVVMVFNDIENTETNNENGLKKEDIDDDEESDQTNSFVEESETN